MSSSSKDHVGMRRLKRDHCRLMAGGARGVVRSSLSLMVKRAWEPPACGGSSADTPHPPAVSYSSILGSWALAVGGRCLGVCARQLHCPVSCRVRFERLPPTLD